VTLYLGDKPPRVMEDIEVVLVKAESAVATLEKFVRRLREQLRVLSIHEYDDTVTLREVLETVMTFEYTIHISERIESYLGELGEEGRLVGLQWEQISHWIPDEHKALLRDYLAADTDYEDVKARLHTLPTDRLTDPVSLARILGYGRTEVSENGRLHSRGYRQLARVPRLPQRIAERLVDEFGSLKHLTEASKKDLVDVQEVSRVRAQAITRSLRRPEEPVAPADPAG
jgi:diadenylate cyclase